MISLRELTVLLSEGTAEEIASLQTQLATVEQQIKRSITPLETRKTKLSQLLSQKQQRLAAEQKQAAARQPAQVPPNQQAATDSQQTPT